ncbi:MAG: hypothetical protein GY758_12850 [Fuerstiella sp.]|nr:hypothetical protein [Fuerstiella sp.]MCP4508046.1 hypothetical protein [Fuerstiella sp.]
MLIVAAFVILSGSRDSAVAELGYHIAPKQVIPYKVNIVATTPSPQDTMTGTIVFTGKQSGDAQFTVGYAGGLSRRTQTRSSGRPGRGGFGPFRSMGGPRPPSPFG